ncbi:MAG: SDR family oxidoreductase, partial [Thermoplasmata archaeon]|nr:SDR family oxidoreductase [Thermoplasmata archaeon]
YETTKGLAALGAHVVMVCRDAGRCDGAKDAIEAAVPGASLETMLCDLASQQDIRRFATEFKAAHDRLDVLFNNAGGIPNERKETVDGIEWQLAVNHLAPFLMTHLLMDVLMASAPSHVMTTSSGTHPRGKVDMDDLQAKRRYKPMKRYSSTKLMNILFTRSLAKRLEGTEVRANCLSPGFVDTGLSRDYGPVMKWLVRRIAKSQEEGGKTPVFVISAPELEGVSGAYFRNMERKDVSKKATDDELAEALWRESERLVGLTSEEQAAMPVR